MSILPSHQRTLDGFETYYLARTMYDLYNNFQLTARFNHSVDRPLLSQALKALLSKYPNLACNAFRTEGSAADDRKLKYRNFVLRPAATILFDDVVSFHQGPFDKAALKSIDSQKCPTNTEKPTWRIRVYEDGDAQYITMYNCHLFLDGQSGKHFFLELTKILGDLESQALEFEPVLFDYQKQKDSLPALTEASSRTSGMHTGSFYQRFSIILSEVLPKSVISYWNSLFPFYPDIKKHPVVELEHERCTDPDPLLFSLPAETVAQLATVSRKNGISITPLLQSIAGYCLQETFLKKYTHDELSVMSVLPISARRYYPELEEELKFSLCAFGCYPIFDPIPNNDPSTLLAVSKRVNAHMNHDIATRYNTKKIEFFNWLDLYDYLKPTATKSKTKETFEISNAGVFVAKAGKWEIVDAFFSQSLGISLSFSHSVAGTPKGGINIGVSIAKEFNVEIPQQDLQRVNAILDSELAPGSVYADAYEKLVYQTISKFTN